jgi:hypothetical protein
MDLKLEKLIADSRSLRSEFSDLAEVFVTACEDMRDTGMPIDGSLLERGAQANFRFLSLVDAYLTLDVDRSGDHAMREKPRTLDHLDELIERVIESAKQQSTRSELDGLLTKASQIEWPESADETFVNDLATAIASGRAYLASADTQQLMILSVTNPAIALAKIIEHSTEIDEEQHEKLSDAVEGHFGKRLLRTALRNRLRFRSGNIGENTSTEESFDANTVESPSEAFKVATDASDVACSHPLQLVAESEPEQVEITNTRAEEKASDSSSHESQPDSQGLGTSQEENEIPNSQAAFSCKDNSVVDVDEPTISIEEEVLVASKSSLNGSPAMYAGIPSHLTSYGSFTEQFYVNQSGQVKEQSLFTNRNDSAYNLERAYEHWLTNKQFAHVWTICRAIECIGKTPPSRTTDLSDLSQFLQGGASIRKLGEQSRTQRLREAIKYEEAEPNLLLTLFIQAFSPATEDFLNDKEIELLIERCASADENLKRVISKVLQMHARDSFSIDLIRSRVFEVPSVTTGAIEETMKNHASILHEEVRKLWSAAGGRIRTTHSREAWDEFIAIADQIFEPAYKVQETGQLSLQEFEKRVLKLRDYAKRICERNDVQQGDRKRFERSVETLISLAMNLVSWSKDLERAKRRNDDHVEQLIPSIELKALLSYSESKDPWLATFCLLLKLVFHETGKDSGHHKLQPNSGIQFSFTFEDICKYPDLLKFVSLDEISDSIYIEPTQVSDPLALACILLEDPISVTVSAPTQLFSQLFADGRFELLKVNSKLLSSQQKEEFKRFQAGQGMQVAQLITQLKQSHRSLQELALPVSEQVSRILRECESLGDGLLDDSLDSTLFLEYLSQVCEYCDTTLNEGARQLLDRTLSLTLERRQQLEQKIQLRQFADALYLLGEKGKRDSGWQRETTWRDLAKIEFAEPALALRRIIDQADFAKEFLTEWARGYEGQIRADQPLRTKFARMMFSSTDKDDASSKPRGRNESSGFRVSCKNVLDWFAAQKLNPTFVPQLRQYSDIIILTPLVKSSSPSFVESLRSHAAKEFGKDSKDLGVFLVPGITEAVRADVMREFSSHGLRASIIDDLDICRLLNPGGKKINLLLGLVEQVLEQQPLQAFSPYHKHDGQHVTQEMFVGRRDQVREIALTTQYSRLFSGRKLGKSALLSYVQQTHDNTKLASGNTLRVLYISGVGAGGESEFVQRIVDALARQIGFSVPDIVPPSDSKNPAAFKLVKCFELLCDTRKEESWLILFDEADLFMERQIAEYDRRQEDCLSFAIRSNVESHRDSTGLPRVRFLFSGYRVTHKSDGAWTGAWGDVLRLEPLHPDDASTLVRGPLDRLGIKSSEIAHTIAWRCGYQPALIIGFCRQLLQQKGLRERIDDLAVAETFEHANVQDEIRQIIDSNFQGNKVGGVVFLTAIWAFSENGASKGITDLADHITSKLISIESDFGWLNALDQKAALNRVESVVQDLVRRQLLRVETSTKGQRTYFARFPHHIPTLSRDLSRDPEGRIRRSIEECRNGDSRKAQGDPLEFILSLYSAAELETAKIAIASADPQMPLMGVVFPDDWIDACPVGLITQDDLVKVDAGKGKIESLCDTSRQLMIMNCRGNFWSKQVLQATANRPPFLIGGFDLLREVLTREIESDEFYLVLGIGRLSKATLQWWFNRKRALEFDQGGLDAIYGATSGIPILVRSLDEIIKQRGGIDGTNMSNAELASAFAELGSQLTQIASRLSNQTTGLTKRERELLKMIGIASEAMSDEDAIRDLLGWEDLFSETGFEVVAPRDMISIRLLQTTGLVPLVGLTTGRSPIDQLARVPADDALFKLLKAMEQLP